MRPAAGGPDGRARAPSSIPRPSLRGGGREARGGPRAVSRYMERTGGVPVVYRESQTGGHRRPPRPPRPHIMRSESALPTFTSTSSSATLSPLSSSISSVVSYAPLPAAITARMSSEELVATS